MEIIRTNPGDDHFHLFEDIVKLLYLPDSIRHKQSESINREFLEACYVVVTDNKPKARIALYNNPSLFYNHRKAICIGNYECTDDKNISEFLINHVLSEARKLKADFIIGPMNGSTWDNYRFSKHHEYANFLLEPWHHLYYNDHFLKAGFDPVSHYTSSINKHIICDDPEILKRDSDFAEQGVVIRNINMNEYEVELKKLYPFISSVFKTNFLHTPVSWETFRTKYLEAAKIINPEYVLIAEDTERNILGFIFCYDDLFSKEKSLVIKTIARVNSKKWSGLGHVLGNRVVRLAKAKGYKSLVHAFMIEQATSVGLSKDFSGEIYKKYVLYGMKL